MQRVCKHTQLMVNLCIENCSSTRCNLGWRAYFKPIFVRMWLTLSSSVALVKGLTIYPAAPC